MPVQEEKEMLVQLAELRQQMAAMSNSVDEIKSAVKEVLGLDRTIAELTVHYQQQAREIQTQWGKIDAQDKATAVPEGFHEYGATLKTSRTEYE